MANVIPRVSGNAIIRLVFDPVMKLLKDVIKDEDNRQILQTDLRRLENLLLDITTLFRDELDITTFFQNQEKAPLETVKTWLQLLQNSLTEAERLLSIDRSVPRQSCLDCLVCTRSRLSEEIRDCNAFLDQLYHAFQSDLSMFLTSLQFLSSNPLHIEDQEALLPDEKAEESGEEESAEEESAEEESPEEESAEEGRLSSDEGWSLFRRVASAEEGRLSSDEAWSLFRRVAFKDNQVSMDIQDRARRFADECKGMRLAINVVAAMIGQTSVDKWDTCFSLLKNVDPSFPATHPHLDAELYRLLRWSYDSLPNSNVKNCFLYCGMYMKNQEINSRDLVQMWIGEGLVKSKQGTYLMDMALARKYLKLLLDRCLFKIVKDSTTVFNNYSSRVYDVLPLIRVHDAIREMAMYIGPKEENCLYMAGQNLQNFPEAHDENCRRISIANNFDGDLPTDLRCPKLASLTLEGNKNLKELPSEFLVSLTSLRVLNLSCCTEITSLPTSVGQLRLLEFLSLSQLPIKDLPEEICNLSGLQFLNLSSCKHLESLPSKIGELKNLRCLNLDECDGLSVIPHEISELTSLCRLQLYSTYLSVELEAQASIWSLKGLQNLTELELWIGGPQDGKKSKIKDGIMATWSEMRHLKLVSFSVEIEDDLPEDMKSMKKLQSFTLWRYKKLSLPNCKFEHLEMVEILDCPNISGLSPLEWLPNLKLLKLNECNGLRELGIGSRGYQRLQKLVLKKLKNLESLGGPPNTGMWDERTLPHLRVLKIKHCSSLRRFPIGMEKLPNLCTLRGYVDWWRSIMWQDDYTKIKLENVFKEY